MSGVGALILIYAILLLGIAATIFWYFFMKHRTKVRMRELEKSWRHELKQKGLTQVQIEEVVEQRKHTYVLQHPYSRRYFPRE